MIEEDFRDSSETYKRKDEMWRQTMVINKKPISFEIYKDQNSDYARELNDILVQLLILRKKREVNERI